MVLASPWERLPRAAQSLAERREQQGIATAFRGRAGWRMATGHLRAGGTVVALVDSLSPRRPGRRALNFVAGPVGAPDALLAWAERQGAEVRVALGRPGGFVIETLEAHAGVGPGMSRSATSDSLRRRSDQCVERLQQAVEANPSSWAWVRALALLVFALPSLSLSSCSAAELVPPLPRDPADWITEAVGLRWTGEVDAGLRGRLHAAKAVGEWKDGKPHGEFTDVIVDLFSADTGLLMTSLTAARARGSWPEGPTSFEQVDWKLPLTDEEGRLEKLHWDAGEGWQCGGCPLEGLSR